MSPSDSPTEVNPVLPPVERITAGALDVTALLENARTKLDMLDGNLSDLIESQAKILATAYPEIAIARALLVVALNASNTYEKYTAETNAHSDTRSLLTELRAQVAALTAPKEPKDGLRVH